MNHASNVLRADGHDNLALRAVNCSNLYSNTASEVEKVCLTFRRITLNDVFTNKHIRQRTDHINDHLSDTNILLTE